MTHLRNQCIDCDTELFTNNYKCPENENHTVEEIYSVRCTNCDKEFEQSDSDPCPHCGEEVEEYE